MIFVDRLIQYKKSQTNTFQRPWGRLHRKIPLGSKVAISPKIWMASRDYSVKPWLNLFNSKSLLDDANNSESFTWKSSQWKAEWFWLWQRLHRVGLRFRFGAKSRYELKYFAFTWAISVRSDIAQISLRTQILDLPRVMIIYCYGNAFRPFDRGGSR